MPSKCGHKGTSPSPRPRVKNPSGINLFIHCLETPKLIVLFTLALFLAATPAFADIRDWNTLEGDWLDPGNWTITADPADQANVNNDGIARLMGPDAVVTHETVHVGTNGQGQVEILNGGTLTATSLVQVGVNSGDGTLIVDGPGSQLQTHRLELGYLGTTGTLTVANGASVVVDEFLFGYGNVTLNIGNGGPAGTLQINSMISSNRDSNTNIAINFNHNEEAFYFAQDDRWSMWGDVVPFYVTEINHLGPGTTILDGNYDDWYAVDTTISSGVLRIDGVFRNFTTYVNTGGTLAGSGWVGSVLVNGGTVAPGSSIGTLNVSGSVDFSGGGTYAVEVDAAGDADRISATGAATLDGGTLRVMPLPGVYSGNTEYTILTADSIDGTLALASPSLAFCDFALAYTATEATLSLMRRPFDAIGGTPNQRAVGAALNSLETTGASGMDGLFAALLALESETGALFAYNALSGIQHAHAQTLALEAGRQFRNLLNERLSAGGAVNADTRQVLLADASSDRGLLATTTSRSQSVSAGPEGTDKGSHLWVRGLGGYGDINRSSEASGADYHTSGAALGVDRMLANDLTLGAAFGYVNTDADTADGGLDIDSWQLALYSGWIPGPYYLRGMASAGLHRIGAKRQVAFGSFDQTASASYDSVTWGADIEGGRAFDLGLNIAPFAGLEYAHLRRESFIESGTDTAALDVKTEKQMSLRSRLGVRLDKEYVIRGMIIAPSLESAWVHEFADELARIDARFAGSATVSFDIEGPELDRDRLQIGVGLDARFNTRFAMSLGYRLDAANSDQHQKIAATLHLLW
ncbi:autotransporter domain-containing protein [Syntrophotalea acetylenica]|uniref:autotransporter family protein n=1 Tax=Syntrophotalea acetylenica TaxID=29542 RepID=UPI002A35DC66|nr:autotransporter domain-containing protein [Syntrophotalea acetylenica]MDY0263321.1 autotransporter domain-containing protein [Syntrophotalea acetylenica]